MSSSRTRVPSGTKKFRISCTRIGSTIAILLIFLQHRQANGLMSNSVDNWVSDSAVVCNVIPGLTKEQRKLCYWNPDGTFAALKGLQIAIAECQRQFAWNRWNCSSLTVKSRTQRNSVFLQRGYQETAFAHAISAAGVAHSVTRACGMGRLISCGCGSSSSEEKIPAGARGVQWKWGGCSHNLEYGMKFSREFLNTSEKSEDMQSAVNLHNDQVGRLAIASSMKTRCRCHGFSGGCEFKTCWKLAPNFRTIGKMLKDRYGNAIRVAQNNNGDLIASTSSGESRERRPDRQQRQTKRQFCAGDDCTLETKSLTEQLLYYRKSPTFCEKDQLVDVPGTAGRPCNHGSSDIDSCELLCCGRGYDTVKQARNEKCKNIFYWFEHCRNVKWLTVCK